jgi:DNA invertase Pin-like site-specific DNA recombinase
MNEKIKPDHLQRAAYVYVRQSTNYQVRHHREGQQRQYDLAQRARQLGFTQVIVLDEDLGRSGSGLQERPGFGRLLAAVCQGQVGAVLALEASRLARNNRDWHHLVDLCALTGTLLIDDEGTYDPKVLNDRLLLGLKGTMSEFELGLMRQRARQAYLQKVKRGEAMWEVPTGFVRSKEGQIEKTPDRQVQQAIEMVLVKFRQLALSALIRLAELVRCHRLPNPIGRAFSDTSLPTKGHHVSKPKSNSSSNPIASIQEGTLGEIPRTDARALQTGVNSDPAARRTSSLGRKESR